MDNVKLNISSPAQSMNIEVLHQAEHKDNGFGFLDNFGVNCFSLLVTKIEDKYEHIKNTFDDNITATTLSEKNINGKILKIFFTKSQKTNALVEFIQIL